VLLAALRALGDAPTRSLTALAQRLGVSETDAAPVVAPLEEASAPVVAIPVEITPPTIAALQLVFRPPVTDTHRQYGR
jgi:hypothetical protein